MKHLLFFTALVATANGLSCQCSGLQGCSKDVCSVTNGSCFSFQGESIIERKKAVQLTLKGCQDSAAVSNICKEGVLFMLSGKDFYLMSNVACSDKDQCNKNVTAELKKKDISSRSQTCPSCFALSQKSCDSHQIYCTRLQDKCFTLIGTIRRGMSAAEELIAKGCATATASIYKNGTTLPFGNVSYYLLSVHFEEARNGVSQISSCLSFAVLLPGVLVFWLDKCLY
ncbi:phospholipase A2 inhibitor NAI-like [Candoia aspera]|uniref:phospholipase A2 inhibitor NAI-like n=1 Tax=Candoia aspera TaxID=51853 RepID=UPI002FD80E1D